MRLSHRWVNETLELVARQVSGAEEFTDGLTPHQLGYLTAFLLADCLPDGDLQSFELGLEAGANYCVDVRIRERQEL